MQLNRALQPTISRVLVLNGSRRCAAVARRIQLFEYAAEKTVLCQLRQIFCVLKMRGAAHAAAGRPPGGTALAS